MLGIINIPPYNTGLQACYIPKDVGKFSKINDTCSETTQQFAYLDIRFHPLCESALGCVEGMTYP